MSTTPAPDVNDAYQALVYTKPPADQIDEQSRDGATDLHDLQPDEGRFESTEAPSTSMGNQPSATLVTPSKERIDAATEKLWNSIKVVAVTDCPVHPARSFCDCPAGLAALQPEDIYHCKMNIFLLYWDIKLLGGCTEAFDYNGDQASHRAFFEKVGKTPKHFARAFLQKMPISNLFLPTGRLKDTVQALVEYWIVRNAQWKAKYGTREVAHKEWLHETYDLSNARTVSDMDLVGGENNVGDTMTTVECKYGPPGHVCTMQLLPVDGAGGPGGPFALKILDEKHCHTPCPVSDPLQDEALRGVMRDIGVQYGYEVDTSKMESGSADDMRRQIVEKKAREGAAKR